MTLNIAKIATYHATCAPARLPEQRLGEVENDFARERPRMQAGTSKPGVWWTNWNACKGPHLQSVRLQL